MFLLLTLNISRTFSSVSIGDFEQVNINLEALETFTISNNKSDIRMNTGKYFWRKFSSFITSSATFSEFDARNAILLQINDLGLTN